MEFAALILLFIAAVALQNRLYKKKGLTHLKYNCYFTDKEVTEGHETTFVEELVNNKWLPLPWLKSEIITSKWLDFAETQSVVTDQSRYVSSYFLLKGYHKISRTWKVTCIRRGIYCLDKVVLVSTDLLGNVSLSQVIPVNTVITVLPEPLDLEDIQDNPHRLSGDIVTRRGLIPDPFWVAGVKEYLPGDNFKRIAWALSASQNRLMVLENDSTISRRIAIIANFQSREFETEQILDSEQTENTIKLSAAYLQDSLSDKIPVCMITNAITGVIKGHGVEYDSDVTEPGLMTAYGSGYEHVQQLMYNLSQVADRTSESFEGLLQHADECLLATDIILITGYLCPAVWDFVENKRSKGIFVRVAVTFEPEEEDLSLPGIVWMPNLFLKGEVG